MHMRFSDCFGVVVRFIFHLVVVVVVVFFFLSIVFTQSVDLLYLPDCST